jgi:hypothetical protein
VGPGSTPAPNSPKGSGSGKGSRGVGVKPTLGGPARSRTGVKPTLRGAGLSGGGTVVFRLGVGTAETLKMSAKYLIASIWVSPRGRERR